MPKTNLTILKNESVLFFLLMPFFKPASLEFISPGIEVLFNGWRVLSFALILFLYLMSGRMSKLIVTISAYEVMLLVSTILNDGAYWGLAVNCGTVIGFCMLTEICIRQNCKKYFSAIFRIYFVLVLINFVVLLLFPEGIAVDSYYSKNTYNFLGIDNSLAVAVTLPLMSVACLYSAFKNRRLTFAAFLMLVILSATTLITWSATGVVAWFVMAAYILFIYKSRLTKYFNSYVLFITFAIMQVTIVFLRLQEYFAFIIETVLGKNITFTGRTLVWDLSYLIILQSPIIGHGVQEGHGLIHIFNTFVYSHNGVLEVLLQTGVIGLVLYVIPFVMAAKRLYRHREHFLAGIVSVTLFSFMVEFLTEAQIASIWIFGFLVIAYYIPTIIQQYEAGAHKRPAVYQPSLSNLRM